MLSQVVADDLLDALGLALSGFRFPQAPVDAEPNTDDVLGAPMNIFYPRVAGGDLTSGGQCL